MFEFPPGSSGKSIHMIVRDKLSAQPLPGLTAASAGATARYTREGGFPATFTLVDLAAVDAAWQLGGFIELMPGFYRIDVPDPAVALGAGFVSVGLTFDGAIGDGALITLRQPTNNVGAGGTLFTITVQASAPLAGASVWISTDAAGTNVVAGALATDAFGQVAFLLDTGTFYAWVQRVGYTASNPTAITVSGAAGAATILMSATVAPAALSPVAAHLGRVTAHDVVSRLYDYFGSNPSPNALKDVKRALLDGYRELTTAARWTYLTAHTRLQLHGLYATGTVAYDHTGGTHERQLTLTDGTWPAWAARGFVRIDSIVYPVDRRISDTVLTLDATLNPGADLDAGTTYTLAQDTYSLPVDYVAADQPLLPTAWGGLHYVRPHEWLATVRTLENYGEPICYTITGDPDVPGGLALRCYPAPATDQTLDLLYQRSPRPITTIEATTGKVTIDAINTPTVVTLTGGSFSTDQVGAVLRVSATATPVPDGREGAHPFAEERTVTQVLSTSQAVVDQPFATSYTSVAYRLSDPIDFEERMLNAYYRCCEKQAGIVRILENQQEAMLAYNQALLLAREADARVMERRGAGSSAPYPARMADFPRGPDIS